MPHKLICITGLPGAGKSILSELFSKYGFEYVRFGQIVIDELQKQNWEINEVNERHMRESLRQKHGTAAMALLNLDRIKNLLEKDNVIADGLYSFEEYKTLKDTFCAQMNLIAIYAPPALRYQRLAHRKVRPLTQAEAHTRDYSEIENLNKGGAIAMADYMVVNTKDFSHLKNQFQEILHSINSED